MLGLRALNLLPRVLIPAVLVFASCADRSEVPPENMPGSRLVGTWESDLSLDPKLAKYLEKARANSGAAPDSEGPPPLRLTFSPDGVYTMEGAIFEHPIRESARWRVVEEGQDHISVELIDPDKDASSGTFKFQSEDVIAIQWTERSATSYFRRLR